MARKIRSTFRSKKNTREVNLAAKAYRGIQTGLQRSQFGGSDVERTRTKGSGRVTSKHTFYQYPIGASLDS